MFCAPFYDFLEQVSKRAAHSFKSETPLIDAMYVDTNAYAEQLLIMLQDHVHA